MDDQRRSSRLSQGASALAVAVGSARKTPGVCTQRYQAACLEVPQERLGRSVALAAHCGKLLRIATCAPGKERTIESVTVCCLQQKTRYVAFEVVRERSAAAKAAWHDPRIALAGRRGESRRAFPANAGEANQGHSEPERLGGAIQSRKDVHTCEHEPFHQGLAQEPHYPRMGREADHGSAGPARRFVVEASSFVSQEQGSHSRRDP